MKSRELDRGTIEGKAVSNEASNRPTSPVAGTSGGFDSDEADAAKDAALNDFTPAELRDFLAADHLESHADPGFKERLRKKLWNFIRDRYGSGSSSSDSS